MAATPGLPPSGAPSSPRPKKDRRDTREMVRIGAVFIAVVLLIAFVLDNSQTVKVGFVFFNTDISLIWVLLIAAVLGALIDRLAILLYQRRKARAHKQGR